MLGGEVAAAGALVVIVVVPGLLTTAVRETADVATDATEATRAGVARTVEAADLGVVAAAAVVVARIVVVIVTLGKRHLVHPVVEHTLVVRPETRLVVHCPDHVGR
ncbi:hypothetical protein OG417_10545 [Actinoallomurus sp. NBC_01490]|uniref:hypothetical protein n=1 Tax=Actinoallomurus sp. NBC_01490 TaxID=2903557 RepID=UPI002E34A1F9|nr:hypothetical protein [Actinoallomurus sp. NBC_01490]